MRTRVTFTVCGTETGVVGDLVEKVRRFADAMETFIKSHTIINRDDSEHRSWVVNVPPDTPSITCLLSRQNDSEIVSFGFVATQNDKMPDVQKVVAYLYPEFA